MAHGYKTSANGGELRGEVSSSPTGLVFEGVWACLAMTRGPVRYTHDFFLEKSGKAANTSRPQLKAQIYQSPDRGTTDGQFDRESGFWVRRSANRSSPQITPISSERLSKHSRGPWTPGCQQATPSPPRSIGSGMTLDTPPICCLATPRSHGLTI